jgi:hypothetical protein
VLFIEYRDPSSNVTPGHIPITEVFVTGDLAFQAMALGKELMAEHHYMQCKASRQQFTDSCELWNMNELMRCGEDAEKGNPLLGVKKNHGGPSYLCPTT